MVGQPGILQTKITSDVTIEAPVIVLRPDNLKALQLPVLYRVLTLTEQLADDGVIPGGPSPGPGGLDPSESPKGIFIYSCPTILLA